MHEFIFYRSDVTYCWVEWCVPSVHVEVSADFSLSMRVFRLTVWFLIESRNTVWQFDDKECLGIQLAATLMKLKDRNKTLQLSTRSPLISLRAAHQGHVRQDRFNKFNAVTPAVGYSEFSGYTP